MSFGFRVELVEGDITDQHGLRSIAFPGISTGVYGFPFERAVRIAIAEARKFLATAVVVEKIVFVCFGQQAFARYEAVLGELTE